MSQSQSLHQSKMFPRPRHTQKPCPRMTNIQAVKHEMKLQISSRLYLMDKSPGFMFWRRSIQPTLLLDQRSPRASGNWMRRHQQKSQVTQCLRQSGRRTRRRRRRPHSRSQYLLLLQLCCLLLKIERPRRPRNHHPSISIFSSARKKRTGSP